jgi:hypothetical protein
MSPNPSHARQDRSATTDDRAGRELRRTIEIGGMGVVAVGITTTPLKLIS